MTLATILEDAAAEQNQTNRHAARTPAHLAKPSTRLPHTAYTTTHCTAAAGR